MNSQRSKPRRPWVAALLSLTGGPTGQIYAGQLRRSVVLWAVGLCLLFVVMFANVTIRLGPLGIGAFASLAAGYYFFPPIDAYLLAKRQGDVPLKAYQRPWWYALAVCAFGCGNLLAALLCRQFVAEAFVVPTRAMAPTILAGDRILVDKWQRPASWWKRNDVVVFRSSGPGSDLYVMRLVGLPGDTLQIIDERLFLNGQEWNDPHAFHDPATPEDPVLANYGPEEIPPDSFFMLGDNRRIARDSRILGPIPSSDMYGQARLIYWSQERRFPDPWNRQQYELGPVHWSRLGQRLD